ncbi:MAG: porin [Porticoccaceae bacterium]|nr:porin [Porticoccaceae bacterium]
MANIFWRAFLTTALATISFGATVSIADDRREDILSTSPPVTNWFWNSGFWDGLQTGGRIVVDADQFDGIYRQDDGANDSANDKQHETELRRARLYFKLPIAEDWSSKIQLSLTEEDNKYELKDAYLRYKGWSLADIRIGQSKEPFGLENLTSSLNSSVIERSLAASAFALGRNPGINIADSNSKRSWSLGLYEVGNNAGTKEDGGLAYTARVTFSPVNDNPEYIHFGISFSNRDLDGSEYEIESDGGVHSAINFLDTANIETDSIDQIGLESAWGRGALSLQAEYQYQKIEATESINSTSYQAYYLQGSYFLSGDHRPYKKGRFGTVKPSSSAGAIELVLRYGSLGSINLDDKINSGTDFQLNSLLFGVNYHLNKRIKFMLNVISTDSTGIFKDDDQEEGDAISLRVQLRF